MKLSSSSSTLGTSSNNNSSNNNNNNNVDNDDVIMNYNNTNVDQLKSSSRKMKKDDDNTNNDDRDSNNIVEKMISDMTLEQLIGQMSQIDINMILEEDKMSLNIDAATKYIGELGIGSVLNVPSAKVPWTARQYRETLIAINQIALKYNNTPPVIWGIDSVHGANYIDTATITPQPINIAASFNTTMSYQAGQIASQDTKAAGISWLFSPLLGIAIESKWSRIYETFGEDPIVVRDMASNMIRGIQEPTTESSNGNVYPSRAAACAKHFIGYSMPLHGHDRTPSWIPTRHLYQYFVPPWKKVLGPYNTGSNSMIDYSKAMTVMESYTETDGVPNVANSAALNYLLRYRLQFPGVLVTDYQEILNLNYWHHTTGTKLDATITALREGSVDISMIPWEAETYISAIKEGISTNALSLDRIQQSVRRVLQLKYDLGMLNNTLTIVDPDLDKIGNDHDRAKALAIAEDSIILVKNNNNILPISRNKKIHVTGPTANSLIYQSGGWTAQWQGISNESIWTSYGTRVIDGIRSQFTSVTYTCGVDIMGNDCNDPKETVRHWDDNVIESVKHWTGLTPSTSIARTIEMAKESDIVIVCVGEEAYAEKPGDIRSLRLAQGQYDLVRAIQQNIIPSTTKIILVYFGGRPRLLNDMVERVDGVLLAFLPGPDSGTAIAKILDGTINPSGKLPITYPLYEDNGGVPYFHAISDQCTTAAGSNNNDPDSDSKIPLPHYQYIPCPVQWSFGHGLSYTEFAYSSFTAQGGIDVDLHVSVVVENTGTVVGKDVIYFFTFAEYRNGVTPEYKRLRAFEKVTLRPGEKITVRKVISQIDLRFIGPHDDKHYIKDPTMKTWVGVGATTDCRIENSNENPLCISLASSNPDQLYSPSCDAACSLWIGSGCNVHYNIPDRTSCLNLCLGVSSTKQSKSKSSSSSSIPYYPNDDNGWGWEYVNCLESVIWGMQQRKAAVAVASDGTDGAVSECWMMTSLCRDVFRTGIYNQYGQLRNSTSSSSGSSSNFNSPSMGYMQPADVSHNNNSTSIIPIIFALITGMVATWLISVLRDQIRKNNKGGGNVEPNDDERFSGIQFTQVRTIT